MRVTPLEPSAPLSPAHSPRRTFVARLAWRDRDVAVRWQPTGAIVASRLAISPARGLTHSLLDALGDAVLPAELGPTAMTRAVGEFQRWMDGYRPGAEANHGYGTGRIEQLPADPRPQWRSQLAALDADARRERAHSFARLLARASSGTGAHGARRTNAATRCLRRSRRATSPLALLAHFYDSPAATDLCYEAQIGRQQCRPLAAHDAAAGGARAEGPMTLVRRQGRAEVIESDICIIGSGITAAMVAEKLAEERQARDRRRGGGRRHRAARRARGASRDGFVATARIRGDATTSTA